MRKKLTGDETEEETLLAMAEGNPGAIRVLGEILEFSPSAHLDFLILDDMNMRGSQLWVAYKNHCDFSIDRLLKCIRRRDEDMINKVNEACEESLGEKAKSSYGS